MIGRNGPWTVLGSTIKYQNGWITLREDNVIHPDGKPGVYGVVNFPPGISVIPVDEEGKVHLVEEFRYAIQKKSIEACSGAMEKGEAPLACAKRELQEELGIIAEEWTELGVVYPLTGNIDTPANLFLARKLAFVASQPEGNEILTPIKMPFEKAVKMVMESKIVHAPSCVLILKAKEYLEKL